MLYALAVFTLLVTYFILTHLRERRIGNDYDSRYSYGTGSVVEDRPHRRNERRTGGRTGNIVKGAIAGVGLYALADRFRRRRSTSRADPAGAPGVGPGGGPEVARHARHSSSYVEDEKFSDYSRDQGGDGVWEDRLLRIAAPIGAAGLVTRYFDRRYRDRESDVEEYSPPLVGPTATNEGRHGEGRLPPGGPVPLNRPLPENRHPLNEPPPYGQRPPNQSLPVGQRPLNRRPSDETNSTYASASGEPRRGHGLRDGIATLGVLGLARSIFNKRRGRNQDQELAAEQDPRVHGGHLTGDGRPARHHRPGLSSISSDTTSLTGTNHPHHGDGIPPIPAGVYPAGAAGAAVATHERDRNRNEELPLGGIPRNGQVAMPPIPPEPQGIFHADSSGSEAYIGDDGRNHWRHRDAAAAGIAGGAVGLAAAKAAEASSSRRDHRDRRQSAGGSVPSVASPPYSIKVKMHDDNRHVTLRRLPEAEAAAERQAREARRRSQERSGRRRGDSASSLSGTEGSGERFRRNQFQERQQAEAMRIESERLAAARVQAQNQRTAMNALAPPPIPESSSNLRPPRTASIGSPGTYDGNTTEASADYANNRRRRRAERAQARQAKEAKGGKTVEFE